MRSDILLRYESQRVPRYTSYPTAPHFTDDIGEEGYRRWLAAVPEPASLSLYLHVPYCRQLCWYCGCHTKITRRPDPVATYCRALRREIAMVADALGSRRRVVHVHWGGGTPTIAEPADFVDVMKEIGDLFEVADGAETAIEVDPRWLSPETVEALARAGVNRASLGIQTFDAKVQRAVNRVQTLDETRAVVDALRAVGIDRISIDLLYGLPHQTVDSCRSTVEAVLSLAPDRLSVFGYAHLPARLKHQRMIDEAALPDGAERLRQLLATGEALRAAGYVAIGLDHFARPDDPLAEALAAGTLHRNFQGYTSDAGDALIGFGASAIGSLPAGYVQNAVPLHDYYDALGAGRLPITRARRLSADDRVRRAVIERLMCDLSVDLDVAAGAEADELAAALPALDPLARDGLVKVDGHRIAVTEEGRPLVRTVAAVFDAYLNPEADRHAKAI